MSAVNTPNHSGLYTMIKKQYERNVLQLLRVIVNTTKKISTGLTNNVCIQC